MNEPALPTESTALARDLGERLREMRSRVATVESCTGGGIAQVITSIAGSSHWFERGFITYSNAAKMEMVGVSRELLDDCGAVSVEVAAAMAKGGVRFSAADYCIAVTGVAGPDGGSIGKPVGTVCIAWAGATRETCSELVQLDGDRHAIRAQSVDHALRGLLDYLRKIT